ncbi:MAG: hypothetical protein P8Y68_14035 [Anaerolineales bacterium]
MSKNNSSKRNKLNSRQVFIISMVVFLGVGIVLSTVVYSTFRNWGMQETNPGVIGTPVFDEEGNLVLPDSSGNQFSDTGNRPFISDKPPAWDGTKRVTMLVMGIDYRDWAAGYEYSRTDTMILLTIDPRSLDLIPQRSIPPIILATCTTTLVGGQPWLSKRLRM